MKRLKGVMYPYVIQLKYLFFKRYKSPFFILSTPRSGSNLLISYLNNIPAVSAHTGEVLHSETLRWRKLKFNAKRNVEAFLLWVINDLTHAIAGLKIMDSQLQKNHLTAQDIYRDIPSSKLIVLYRENLFEQYVSFQVALRTSQWKLDGNEKGTVNKSIDMQIDFDCDDFHQYCDRIKAFYSLVNKTVGADLSRVIKVKYEDLVVDPQKELNRIANFLREKNETFPARTSLRKIIDRHYGNYIINYPEVKELHHSDFVKQNY